MDSGSQVTIISRDMVDKVGLSLSERNVPKVTAFGGSDISIIGTVDLVQISNGEKSHVGRV